MAAQRRIYTVNTTDERYRLNVREEPSLSARVIAHFSYGEKVRIDPKADTPDGWKAVESGGFVMAQYLK